MRMSDTARRVALLARPGAARDAVRGALLEIGADVVAEDDPTSAAPDAIRGTSPQVLMIVLDAISENALDRFDSMLGDPGIEVMFEEADVAAARDGWEAARWRRHLAAKLGHRQDVLPPVAGADVVPAVDALSVQIEELISTDAPDFPPEAQATLPEGASGGEDFRIFDPAGEASDASVEDYVLSIHGLELEPSAIDAPLPDVHGLDLDVGGLDTASSDLHGLDLEPSALDTSLPDIGGAALDAGAFESLPPVNGQDFTASDFDPLLAELDAELPDVALAVPSLPEADWQGGLVDGFGTPESAVAEPAPSEAPAPRTGFGELSLVDDAAPVGAAPTGHVRNVDLGDLERRIAALELVGDDAPAAAGAPVTPPAPAASATAMPPAEMPPLPADAAVAPPGVVLVLAGIGGPDAVRQLLGALPARFPRPVLLRQRLDGARYDKLVTQLQRASALPVVLAQPGEPVRGGHVYVLGDDIGLDAGIGLFVAGGADRLVGQLPPDESAVVVLSGADVALADAIADLHGRGALVAAQSPDGCYDAAASNLVAARGAVAAPPSELAAQLVGRWGR